jgi:hypothetical protein
MAQDEEVWHIGAINGMDNNDCKGLPVLDISKNQAADSGGSLI